MGGRSQSGSIAWAASARASSRDGLPTTRTRLNADQPAGLPSRQIAANYALVSNSASCVCRGGRGIARWSLESLCRGLLSSVRCGSTWPAGKELLAGSLSGVQDDAPARRWLHCIWTSATTLCGSYRTGGARAGPAKRRVAEAAASSLPLVELPRALGGRIKASLRESAGARRWKISGRPALECGPAGCRRHQRSDIRGRESL